MEIIEVTVLAKVRLISTSEGGRLKAVEGGGTYRPNHNFWPDAADAEMGVGIIYLDPAFGLPLGQNSEVKITFLAWPRLLPEILEGREWRIQEGSKVVGYGKILTVFNI